MLRRMQAYRFLTLVDVLYEHRVRLVCSAAVEPTELFTHIHTQAESRAQAQRGDVRPHLPHMHAPRYCGPLAGIDAKAHGLNAEVAAGLQAWIPSCRA